MDPVSRRGLWDLLRRQRQAAVLLTTHFMDEADLLSDDVYILDAGTVACHGSSLQLKVRPRPFAALCNRAEASMPTPPCARILLLQCMASHEHVLCLE